MTRANQSALVLDGNEVKLRLVAERFETKSLVHIDWVRFTCQRRNCDAPSAEVLFPNGGGASEYERAVAFAQMLAAVPDCDGDAAAQALELAHEVADALGEEFVVVQEARKGHDFYRHRISIERHGFECGWVGFQSSSESPRQAAQGRTIHVNLYGAACTFAAKNWNLRLAEIVEARKADLTRCDLALDFFEGIEGGIMRVLREYETGLMNVGGRRPKCNQLGNWTAHSEGARSFYVGSKEAGKQTNTYEKGDQLFGVGQGSPWLRVETRYGNKLRELPSDMLRRPADFFAGASDWHAAMLREADATEIAPAPVKTRGRLPLETVKAEVARLVRWVSSTAAPSLAEIARNAPEVFFCEFAGTTKRPSRVGRFAPSEVAAAFLSLSSTVEGASPSFA